MQTAADMTSEAKVTGVERDLLIKQQHEDKSLHACWKMWETGNGSFEAENGVLMRRERVLGHDIKQLVLPHCHRADVL